MAVTIKDVAREAGVSTTTVSKILNNVPSISDATRERVLEVMKRMDYHPNRRAQNFARQSTQTIAFLTTLDKDIAFKNPHMFETMVGLQNALAKKQYSLSVISVTKDDAEQVLERLISQKSADGVVIHISVVTKAVEKALIQGQLPHIVLGCPEFRTQLCWIDNDNTYSGELAAMFLQEKEYSRIGFIGGYRHDIGSTNRLVGAQHILKDELADDSDLIRLGESTVESGEHLMQELLSTDQPPDSVICANNYLAVGAVKAIQSAGMRIPEDVGVITFDAYPFTEITRPNLSTIDIDVYDLGKQAGESIIQILKKPNLKIQTYRTLTNVIEHGSTDIDEI